MKSFFYHFSYTFFIILIGFGLAFFLLKGFSFVYAMIVNITSENNLEDNPSTTMDQTIINITDVPEENVHLINESKINLIQKDILINTTDSFKSITEGLLMFRGNPQRNFYGKGPVPNEPRVIWRYPEKPMCSESHSLGVDNIWCGAGWTGQPIVWEHDSRIEVIFGGYDGNFHFVDATTGKDIRKPFKTGDIIKGSATLDPDGYPLLYGGSRDNIFRIFSLEKNEVKELWSINSHTLKGIWNDDWDSNPVIVNDILYEGGENGIFYAIKLNRSYNNDGRVVVDPKIIFTYETFNDDLIKKVGDKNLSIENSTLIVKDRVYIANSGGRIIGFDISNIESGIAPVVFDYWVGDDIDATLISDEDGMLYVTAELERWNDRALSLGQFIKIDPLKENPYVWGINLLPKEVSKNKKKSGGAWATPAIKGEYIYLPTHEGKLLTIDKNSGEITSEDDVGFHAWSSPSIVDNELILGICEKPEIRSYDLSDPWKPVLKWNKKVGSGCIESTPTIWKGNIYLSNRDGYFYKISNK